MLNIKDIIVNETINIINYKLTTLPILNEIEEELNNIINENLNVVDSNIITLYRGIGVERDENHFYSPSKEFALEFTRSGRESELRIIKINTNKIYKHNPLPKGYGIDDSNFDEAIRIANEHNYPAIWVDEGYGQPNSVFFINSNYTRNKRSLNENNKSLNENTYKVYHGTNNLFSKFDLNKATEGVVWFTDSIDSIKNQEHGGLGNKYIMTRFIRLNNPAGWNEYDKYSLGQLRNMGYDGVILPDDGVNNYIVFSTKNIRTKPDVNNSSNSNTSDTNSLNINNKTSVTNNQNNNSLDITKSLEEEIYHDPYPKHRGELTFNKVVQRIKGLSSPSTACDLFTTIANRAYKELKRFNSPEEIMENIYWHGTGGYVSGGLKAGFNIVKKGSEGGGGYGEQYHSISVSKSKNKASNFTNLSRSGIVYPVLLRKDATVVEMPKISDSNELEDMLVDLWLKKIDAVKIGDWSNDMSEEELVVLNPLAILTFRGESYPVYNKKKFSNPDINIYRAIFNTIQNNPEPKGKDSNGQANLLKVQYDKSNYTQTSNSNLTEEDIADFNNKETEITNDSTNDDSYYSPLPDFGDRLRSISENNNPLTLYHGTTEKYDRDNISVNKRLSGLYFTTSPAVAKQYGSNIHKFTVSPSAKILNLSDGEDLYRWMFDNGVLDENDMDDIDLENYVMDGRLFMYDISSRTHYVDDIVNTAKYLNYDLVIIPDVLGEDSDNLAYIATDTDVLNENSFSQN